LNYEKRGFSNGTVRHGILTVALYRIVRTDNATCVKLSWQIQKNTEKQI